MKKFLTGLLALVLILSFAGCGIKERVEDTAAEKAAEKIIEGALDADIDIDGDKIVIEGEDDDLTMEIDGDEMTIIDKDSNGSITMNEKGGVELPEGFPIDAAPLMKGYSIVSVIEDHESETSDFYNIGYEVEASVEDVKKFYENYMESYENVHYIPADNGGVIGGSSGRYELYIQYNTSVMNEKYSSVILSVTIDNDYEEEE